jgi:hypothetical protein
MMADQRPNSHATTVSVIGNKSTTELGTSSIFPVLAKGEFKFKSSIDFHI